jgi:2-(1,2-epoxy-1,2-dihydrophenyl)acetyl-CoA isomerase
MIIESRSDAVVTVQMNDPERRNAISIPMRLALLDTFRRLEADASVRAIVLTGGTKLFCVGGDIHAMDGQTIGSALERMRIVHDLIRLMAYSSKPLIAAVEGWAVGGGLAFALLCDTIVAGDGARFKAGFGEIGMLGDAGILHTLPARVGAGRAKQILFYNEVFDCAQALEWGAVDKVVANGAAVDEAARMAGVLAQKAPLPLGLTKSILAAGLESVLAREREVQAMLFSSHDHQEGKAAFLEKRAAVFQGR